ncbi:MAG: glycoside hydrolase family 78 protein [Verrucomicrobiae bacterium]|nr:glycoside hydrolase family 78 protein [Verrucomicrobiae bacterium]
MRTHLLLCWLASVSWLSAALVPQNLRCEYLENPVAVETTRPRLSWEVSSAARGQSQTAYRVLVASSARKLAEDMGDLWDSGKVASGRSSQIEYNGRPLRSRQEAYWKVKVWDKDGLPSEWSRPAQWTMALLEASDWQAEWITFTQKAPFHTNRAELYLPPARYYRREFVPSRPVRRALLRATALGLYEMQLNGRKVGEAYFTPGWTDYRQRVYYQTYDVTALLKPGPNALGAVVAEGWYSGYLAYGLLVGLGPYKTGRDIYGRTPALLAQLELEYGDGSREIVPTDLTWKTTSLGPEREADILMGEVYDARLEMPGWSRAGFDDRQWEPVLPAAIYRHELAPFYDNEGRVRPMDFGFMRPAKMEAYPAPPVRVTQELKPVRITSPTNQVYIFNLGQNFAGIVRLKVKGPAGTRIRLRYGEMLYPDGRLMTENLRKARATDTYILKGDPRGEVWSPRFTFHGFQYVEVTGLPGRPEPDTITGLVLHSDVPLTSRFECSDPVINRLFQNIVWTQRANFLELPTDCPQRDEREGWMGDAQIYARSATYNADVAAFYSKWLREVVEAQFDYGPYPDYCPYPFMVGRGGVATGWTDAGIIVPYTVWKVYGDTRLIERLWPSMTRFMQWRRKVARDYLGIAHPDGNGYGDWLNLNEPTPLEYLDTIYFGYTTRLMAEMAAALGRAEEAADYQDLFQKIRRAFTAKYVKPDGSFTVDTQTAYATALYSGVLPEELRSRTGARLAQKIQEKDYRMSTGFLGTQPLLPALTASGHHDLAVRLFQSRRFPSWGFEVEQGATTIWERWDSYTKEFGFNGAAGNQNASMNSFAHYAFGAVCEWMFATLAGVDTARDGFRQLVLKPHPPTPGSNPENPPIAWVKVAYHSINGPVSVHWRRQPELFEYEVTLPANTTATLHLPANRLEGVLESGKPLNKARGVKVLGLENQRAVLELGSGSYRFTSVVTP